MFVPFAFIKQEVQEGGGLGPLTTAFLTATGITDAIISSALNDFETGLSSYSLTSKFDAIYPFVGGTSNTTKYNFINTSTHTVTWNGGITFASTGVKGNGSSGYGDTGIAATTLSPNIGNFCLYIRTDESPGSGQDSYPQEMGASGDKTNPNLTQFYMQPWGASGTELVLPCNVNTGAGNGSINTGFASSANIKGCCLLSRTSNASLEAYRNGSSVGTVTDVLTGRSYATFTSNIFLLAKGASNGNSTRELAWASIGRSAGLDDTDASNYYTLIQNFQTALSRQV